MTNENASQQLDRPSHPGGQIPADQVADLRAVGGRMTATAPNILLVSIDSLRADHCGHLAEGPSLTPTMDGLADDGVAFEHAIAPGPQTFSSMPAVFTGQSRPGEPPHSYPGESHWERRLAAIDDHLRTHPSLAERLSAQGYATGAVTPNPWTSTAAGFDRGFDEFVDRSNEDTGGRTRALLDRLPGVDTDDKAVKLAVNMLTGSSFFARWEELYDDLRRLRDRLPEPYFLWIFLMDTHFPFLCSRTHREEQTAAGMYYSAYRSERTMRGRDGATSLSPKLSRSLERSYRDTVRATDAFLDRLRVEFAADDPVLLVHSDHGESFGEHGNYGHHHRQLYEENVHVPFLIHGAGRTEDVTRPVSLRSVHDATLEVARTGRVTPGRYAAEYVVAESEGGTNRAVRGERFKYVDTGEDTHLFDLASDPGEERDVEEARQSQREQCRSVLRRFDATRAEKDRIQQTARALVASGAVGPDQRS